MDIPSQMRSRDQRTTYSPAAPQKCQRPRLQAQVWGPAAIDFLSILDISPGSRALDLGCGAMGIVGTLSRLVGDSGTVIGLDIDATQLVRRAVLCQGGKACERFDC